MARLWPVRSPVTRRPMRLNLPSFFDVDDLAGSGALVAADRLGGLERGKPVETKRPENATHGGGRDPGLGGDLLARMTLPAQSLDRRA